MTPDNEFKGDKYSLKEFSSTPYDYDIKATLLDVLESAAEKGSSQAGFTFLPFQGSSSAAENRLRFDELSRRAGAVAATLQNFCHPGDRILILCPSGLEYIIAFYGCVMAGVVAVPAYPVRNAHHMDRLKTILSDAGVVAILTVSGAIDRLKEWASKVTDLPRLIAVDMVPYSLSSQWQRPRLSQSDLVFIQYTSGTTGSPKGVMVTNAQLLANVSRIVSTVGLTSKSVLLSWLPQYHDMGLLVGLIIPLYIVADNILFSPAAFLQRPARWLEAISAFKATLIVAPNFGYRLCNERVKQAELEGIDLSTVEAAICGAEIVKFDTLSIFAKKFGSVGFRSSSIMPAYGMAEAVLMATCETGGLHAICSNFAAASSGRLADISQVHFGDDLKKIGELTASVSCGEAIPDHTVCVVNPNSSIELESGEIGEIWISGPSIAAGYWGKHELNALLFRARIVGRSDKANETEFFRTGDIGTLIEKKLYVLGRVKEMVVVRGRNFFSNDLEKTASDSHPALGADRVIAFSIDLEGDEELAIVHELSRASMRAEESDALIAAIRRSVITEHGICPNMVILVSPATLPRTTSGKLQRGKAREMLIAGELKVAASWRSSPNDQMTLDELAVDVPNPISGIIEYCGPNSLHDYLVKRSQQALGLKYPPELTAGWADLGVDSLKAVQLSELLSSELHLDPPLPATLLFDQPNLASLTLFIEERLGIPKSSPNSEIVEFLI